MFNKLQRLLSLEIKSPEKRERVLGVSEEQLRAGENGGSRALSWASRINSPGVCLALVENFEGCFVFEANQTHSPTREFTTCTVSFRLMRYTVF